MGSEFVKFLAANKDALLALAALGALLMSAITSVFSLYGTIRSKKIDVDIRRQDAVRKLIESDMSKIGEAMHETLARASILVMKFEKQGRSQANFEESIADYKRKIDESKAVLLDTKTEYRYKFHGLEDGLTAIARAADWIKGMRNDPHTAKALLSEADQIRLIVDGAIVRAYRDGQLTSNASQQRIRYRVWRLKRMWSKYKESVQKQSGRDEGAIV